MTKSIRVSLDYEIYKEVDRVFGPYMVDNYEDDDGNYMYSQEDFLNGRVKGALKGNTFFWIKDTAPDYIITAYREFEKQYPIVGENGKTYSY